MFLSNYLHNILFEMSMQVDNLYKTKHTVVEQCVLCGVSALSQSIYAFMQIKEVYDGVD